MMYKRKLVTCPIDLNFDGLEVDPNLVFDELERANNAETKYKSWLKTDDGCLGPILNIFVCRFLKTAQATFMSREYSENNLSRWLDARFIPVFRGVVNNNSITELKLFHFRLQMQSSKEIITKNGVFRYER